MNRRDFFRTLERKLAGGFLLTLLTPVYGWGAVPQFETLYDYYFPKHSNTVLSEYRRMFDEGVLKDNPKWELDERWGSFCRAFRGNEKAFHEFITAKWRTGQGEFGEEWVYMCLLLLLRLGDDQFARLLSRENKRTRELVGMAIDSNIDWKKHPFTETRAVYEYRYVRYVR